jgi:proteic killer suppression protein
LPAVEIFFSKNELQKLCENQRLMVKKFGMPCAKKLRTRLADLQAAESLADIAAGRPHPLTGERLGQFAIDLHGALRLVFESADDPVPVREDGSTAWPNVAKIRIVFIGDYHD